VHRPAGRHCAERESSGSIESALRRTLGVAGLTSMVRQFGVDSQDDASLRLVTPIAWAPGHRSCCCPVFRSGRPTGRHVRPSHEARAGTPGFRRPFMGTRQAERGWSHPPPDLLARRSARRSDGRRGAAVAAEPPLHTRAAAMSWVGRKGVGSGRVR
jgi:hypothetical protein